VSVARFIADQRTNHRVPHTLTCLLLGVSLAWFYKWSKRVNSPGAANGLHTSRDRRRDTIDRAVKVAFKKARRLHGSPRLHQDLRDDGWTVSEKTVADSMRRQGLVARKIKRRRGLTRQDKTAPKFPDLLKRDFTADQPNTKWVGDMTEIPTGPDEQGPKLYLATVIDLYSRRLLGAATGLHPDADLACAAIKMAVAVRGGRQAIWRPDEADRVIFHTDADPPTPRPRSPGCVADWESGNRWAGSGRVSIMQPPKRFSPASNGRSCHGTSSSTPTRPKPLCLTGATTSTTTTDATAQQR
jgi:hypothetical protein